MTAPSPRILVVDDDTAILELVHQALTPRYRVETTDDWVQAINLLSDNRYQLLVLDLGMPVFDAPEFIRRVHTLSSHTNIPILVISAYPNLQQRLDGLPVDAILPKPFAIAALLDNVARLTNGAHAA